MVERPRLDALDVFRGATVAAMLLVNNPGSWAHVYAPLLHAEWHGWTPTDLIFPFFLFIVGVTTDLSFQRQRELGRSGQAVLLRSLRRGALIVLSGLLLNWFPFFAWADVPGIEHPSLLERAAHRWEHLRWTGVLQRIGVVYLVSAPMVLFLRRRALAFVTALLLVGWAALLLAVPVPDTGTAGHAAIADPEATIAAWSDRVLIGRDHLWRGGAWDPEGALSTLGAIATALLGAMAGPLVRRVDRTRLAVVGAAGVVAGLALAPLLPINKNLWTSSYVIFTAGCAALLLALVQRATREGLGPAGRFCRTFGINPYVAFVGSGVMTRVIVSLVRVPHEGRTRPLQSVLYELLFASWLPPKLASLAWGILFVLVWFAILRAMERKGWMVKV